MNIKVRQFGADSDASGESLVQGQVFSNKKIEYMYDEFRNDLKAVGEIDLYEQMQSVEYTKVDEILNRFLETGETSILNGVSKHNAFADKCEVLSQMSETIEELEEYKRKQGIDVDVGLDKIAEQIMSSKDELDKYIKAKLEEFSTAKKNINTEVVKNEKENIEPKE